MYLKVRQILCCFFIRSTLEDVMEMCQYHMCKCNFINPVNFESMNFLGPLNILINEF